MPEVKLLYYKRLVYACGTDEDLARLKLPGNPKIMRASFVRPHRRSVRLIFRALRWAFGDHGIVASFTRRWSCAWMVDGTPIGGPSWGPFPTREAALAWEHENVVAHLLRELKEEAARRTL